MVFLVRIYSSYTNNIEVRTALSRLLAVAGFICAVVFVYVRSKSKSKRDEPIERRRKKVYARGETVREARV